MLMRILLKENGNENNCRWRFVLCCVVLCCVVLSCVVLCCVVFACSCEEDYIWKGGTVCSSSAHREVKNVRKIFDCET
jgi:hypothetical protein